MRRKENRTRLWGFDSFRHSIFNGQSHRGRGCIFLALILILSGCAAKEETELVEVKEEPPLHEVTESMVYDNKEITSITPIGSLEVVDDELHVFPHFNKEEHITVKRIVISGNNLWTNICKDAKKTKNYFNNKKKNYSMVSHEGTTYGYVTINEDEAYLATSSDLPSSYVKLVLEELCSTDT